MKNTYQEKLAGLTKAKEKLEAIKLYDLAAKIQIIIDNL